MPKQLVERKLRRGWFQDNTETLLPYQPLLFTSNTSTSPSPFVFRVGFLDVPL